LVSTIRQHSSTRSLVVPRHTKLQDQSYPADISGLKQHLNKDHRIGGDEFNPNVNGNLFARWLSLISVSADAP